MAVHSLSTFWFDIVLKCIISNETLQFSDRNRLTFDSTDTFSLTLGFLRANTSTDSRKCTGFTNDLVSFFNVSFFYLMDKCRNVDGYRTTLDTFCILTVKASCSLFHCFFFVITETNFFKVCCTYFWILLSYRYFFHHISHYSSPPQCPHPP